MWCGLSRCIISISTVVTSASDNGGEGVERWSRIVVGVDLVWVRVEEGVGGRTLWEERGMGHGLEADGAVQGPGHDAGSLRRA